MNKRSATLIAASLVGVLAVAGAAFASGITGPTASAASEQTPSAATNPVVRTHTKTVVVHRQAASSAPVVQAAPSPGSPSPSMSGDDGSHHDNEGPDDHGNDGNEGPDDHGNDGNEGPDDHGHDDD